MISFFVHSNDNMKPPPWPKCSRLPTAPTNPNYKGPNRPIQHPPCLVHNKNVNFESMTSLKIKQITTITNLIQPKQTPLTDNLNDIPRSNPSRCITINTPTTPPTSTPPTLSNNGSAYTKFDPS